MRRSRVRHKWWSILTLGLIDRRQPRLSLFTVLLNALSLAAVLDFLYRGEIFHQSQELSFARVGYVDESSSRVVLRAPSQFPTHVEMKLSLADSSLISSQVIKVSQTEDFTATYTFNGLNPDTEYLYTTNASHAGSFKTASKTPKQWSLASTSCIKPFYPYNPLSHGLRVKGFEHLSDYYSGDPFDMMLFLGDFIYIDLPVPYGWSKEHYRRTYRQVYASPSWSPALRAVPWVHVYDDHEIINDYYASDGEEGLYKSAMAPFHEYQGAANPSSVFGASKTHFTFEKGDVAFFVLDTRRYRSNQGLADDSHKTMLGLEQRTDLEKWLAKEKKWKVVVSSVPFTQNWQGPDKNDSWAGYLWERNYILDKMKATEGVIILSGVSNPNILIYAFIAFPQRVSSLFASRGRCYFSSGRDPWFSDSVTSSNTNRRIATSTPQPSFQLTLTLRGPS
jgi:alkaline phosphatase D